MGGIGGIGGKFWSAGGIGGTGNGVAPIGGAGGAGGAGGGGGGTGIESIIPFGKREFDSFPFLSISTSFPSFQMVFVFFLLSLHRQKI